MQNRHIAEGFTLLEILVVLFIVSILSGLVVMNLPPALDTNDSVAAVERLHKVMTRALQRAERESVEYGVLLDERGYQILVFEPISQRWQPSLNHEHRYRAFPETFRPYLAMEEGQQMLGGAVADSERTMRIWCHKYCYCLVVKPVFLNCCSTMPVVLRTF